MENNDMESLKEKEQQEEKKQPDFAIKFSRFEKAKKNGLEIEAWVLQTQILIEHGTWVD